MDRKFRSPLGNMVAYLKEHIGASIAYFFLLVVGIAAGISMLQMHSTQYAVQELVLITPMLQSGGVPWLAIITLSVSIHMLCAGLTIFAGMWLPMAPCWLLSVLLRGLIIGTGLGMCVSLLPQSAAILLLILLLLDTAFLLPPMLRLSVESAASLSNRMQKNDGAPMSEYLLRQLRIASGLLICIVLESVLSPMILFLFG